MEQNNIKFLVVTANVGSLFEEFGGELQKSWVSEFHKLVIEKKSTFIGLHLQEIGGKTYEVCKASVHKFFLELSGDKFFQDFHLIHIIDEEYVEEKYTALGCSYFIHKSLSELVEQWNFTEKKFTPFPNGTRINDISDSSHFVQKFKFPLSCYSKNVTKWPRKGFIWTRWKMNGRVFDILNIHLTHDACNVYAALKSPTKYTKHRRKSLEFALERLDESPCDHQILFGDFNVRPDTKSLIEHLMGSVASLHTTVDDDGKPASLVYRSINGSTKELLTIGKRYFHLGNYEAFDQKQVPDMIRFDKEFDWILEKKFREMPVRFPPTYPHKEEPDFQGEPSYSNVRCPSWCDRVIVDKDLYNLCVEHSTFCTYDSYAKDVQVGDHKPVFMEFEYPLG